MSAENSILGKVLSAVDTLRICSRACASVGTHETGDGTTLTSGISDQAQPPPRQHRTQQSNHTANKQTQHWQKHARQRATRRSEIHKTNHAKKAHGVRGKHISNEGRTDLSSTSLRPLRDSMISDSVCRTRPGTAANNKEREARGRSDLKQRSSKVAAMKRHGDKLHQRTEPRPASGSSRQCATTRPHDDSGATTNNRAELHQDSKEAKQKLKHTFLVEVLLQAADHLEEHVRDALGLHRRREDQWSRRQQG